MDMKRWNWLKAVVSIALPLSGGTLIGILTSSKTAWYQSLVKPWFQPPGWLFAPAWTTLYILMGISFYLVWKKGFQENKKAIYLFLGQLALNFTWSFVFFSFQSLLYSFLNIVTLFILLILTFIEFRRISKKAAWLLIPYIGWIMFAAALNLSLLLLN